MKRRSSCAVLSLLITAALGLRAAGVAEEVKPFVPEGELSGYRLTWRDEFAGDSVDTNEWHFRTGARLLSFQKAENVSVADGLMRLTLKKEDAGGLHYTAGGLISRRTFMYGYYEARFRCPRGAGWHTSFWTMRYTPPKKPGEDYAAAVDSGRATDQRAQEIDICEQDSVNNGAYSAGVIDWSGRHGKRSENFGRSRFRDTVPDFAADFHIWGCEFTPTEVKFFRDGKLTHKTDATKFPHGLQSVWLTSVAAAWGSPQKPDRVDDAALPASADFDWVRVYERPAGDGGGKTDGHQPN